MSSESHLYSSAAPVRRTAVLLGITVLAAVLLFVGLAPVAFALDPVVDDQQFTVLENSATGTFVGAVVATDATTYTIIAGNELGAFSIGASSGFLMVADGTQIDYEITPVFSLTVQVEDITGTTDTGLMRIDVLNINDAPTVDDQQFSVAENSANGTSIGTVVATDPDGNPLTYAILAGNTGGTFALNANTGELTVANNTLLDFETNPTFNLWVRVSDGGLMDTAVITINVTDANDPPLALDDSGYTTPEDTTLIVTTPTVLDNDSDQDGDPLTAVLDMPAGNGAVTLNSDGTFTYTPNPNFNGVDTFTYFANDGQANSLLAATVTITVTGTNDPPTAVDDTYTTAMNVPLPVPAPGVVGNDSDPENNPLTAVLDSLPANGSLSFNADGSFVYTPTLNYVGTDSFTYHVQDTEPLNSNVATVFINVSSQAPTANDATFNIDENSPNSTFVGTVTATDPDPGDTLTFAIIAGNTNNAFAIGVASGDITVNNAAALDFETIPVFTLTVEVQDLSGLTDTATITINLNDVNEAPTAADATFSVAENSPNTTFVGTVSASDPDAGDALAYGITAGNTGSTFAIDNGGNITVNDNTLLDFETNPQFVLTVVVTDVGGLTDAATITINVTNVNEFPPDINPQAFTVAEDAANGTILGTVIVTDSDGIDSFTFAILGGDPNGVFGIDSNGQISVVDNSTLDFETTPGYSLNVQVTDSGALTDTAVMTITVTDANDAPVINNLVVTPGTIQETETITLTGVFTDQDAVDAHTVTIVWDDGSAPTVLNLGAGVTAFTAAHTYLDDPATLLDEYIIDVTVDDGLTSDNSITVATVTNVPPLLANLAAAPAALDEGQMITLTGTITEISPLDTFTVMVDWGDGVIDTFNYPAGTTAFMETHTYQDNYNPAAIAVTLADDDDGMDSGSTAVTVNNVPPTVDAGTDFIIADGDPAAFAGAFSDPGTGDTHTIAWDFGDGNGTTGTLTPSYVYPGVGVYTATLTVTDDDGGTDSDTVVVTVISPSDVAATKTVAGNFGEGGTVIYTISLSNNASSAQLDNPGDEFVDVLPPELALVDAQVTIGGGTTAVLTATNTVTWSGSIPAGTSVVLEIEATILPGFQGQTVSNQGQINYDADGDGLNEANTYTDDPNLPGSFDPTTFTVLDVYQVYLPLMRDSVLLAPDLVVTSINASSDLIEVTIENVGNTAVADGFWVDFYINPSTPPTAANQLWPSLSTEGIAWGVTAEIAAGASLTLVYSTAPGAPNEFFVAEESLYNGSLPAGTTVYAQVDSAHESVAYGGVLESHEITGGPYNNIASATAVAP